MTDDKISDKLKAEIEKVNVVPRTVKSHGKVLSEYGYDDFLDYIYTAYSEGDSTRKIAKHFGLSVLTIHYHLKKDMERYEAAKDCKANLRVDQMDNFMQDMIGGSLEYNIYNQIKDTIKWTAGRESSTTYNDKSRDIEEKAQSLIDLIESLPDPRNGK